MRFKRSMIFAFPIFLALALLACSDSDEHLHSANTIYDVTVSASMTRSLDSSSKQVKIDTIRPEDTLIFMVEVSPTKSIRLQKYFWMLDDKEFSTEFSVRKPVPQVGHHNMTFSLIDYFGDTLRDTLQLWVGNHPVLNTENIIPIPGTQSIPASEDVQFAWHAYDPDSIYNLHYRFILTDIQNDTLTDTLTGKPHYSQKDLKPLEKYYWYVQAYNELGMISDSSISGSFFTKGEGDMAGILGQVINANWRSSLRQDLDIMVSLMSPDKKLVKEYKIQGNTKDTVIFTLSPIVAGKYLLAARIPDAPDYSSDTVKVELLENEVATAKVIAIQDTIPPYINSVSGENVDTLDFADTLHFKILDKGGSLVEDRIQTTLENTPLNSSLSKDGKLAVLLPESAKSWNYRLLNISAMDPSGNSAFRTFYIRPSVYWFKTNNDTTVYQNEMLKFFYQDKNPYGFIPKTFYMKLYADKDPMEFNLDGKTEYSFKVSTSNFSLGKNNIQCGIEYTNGISQWISRTVTLMDRNRGEDD